MPDMASEDGTTWRSIQRPDAYTFRAHSESWSLTSIRISWSVKL
jgi:hypothetical protein